MRLHENTIAESPLFTDFDSVWEHVESTYLSELPELAYKAIPSSLQIKESIRQILGMLHE